jgi:hypothetical protein
LLVNSRQRALEHLAVMDGPGALEIGRGASACQLESGAALSSCLFGRGELTLRDTVA